MAKTIGLQFHEVLETPETAKSIYAGLSRAELDAFVAERGLDGKSCKNIPQVIALLEADDEAQARETKE